MKYTFGHEPNKQPITELEPGDVFTVVGSAIHRSDRPFMVGHILPEALKAADAEVVYIDLKDGTPWVWAKRNQPMECWVRKWELDLPTGIGETREVGKLSYGSTFTEAGSGIQRLLVWHTTSALLMAIGCDQNKGVQINLANGEIAPITNSLVVNYLPDVVLEIE
jgi:hypothetical protein